MNPQQPADTCSKPQEPDDEVWVAPKALRGAAPFTMAFHEPGYYDPYARLKVSECFYYHTWITVRRDVAETFARPCKPCANRVKLHGRGALARGHAALQAVAD